MVVAPVDAVMLLSPLLWAPEQARAIVAMAALSLALLNAAGRHRAQISLSVLDLLPWLLGRLLVAAALVATGIALRHEQEAVVLFLVGTTAAIGGVVAGRVLTTRLTAWARGRRIARHSAIVIGGDAVAADLCRVLREDPQYGLTAVGYIDDARRAAQAWVPRLGSLADLDRAVLESGATVLIVAGGSDAALIDPALIDPALIDPAQVDRAHFDPALFDAALIDAVRTPVSASCELLVVPRLHHFQTRTGQADHIGSIPIMRIRTPTMRGPAHAVKRTFDVLVAGLALTAVSPLLAACALAVRIEGGPGVIFRQPRVGRDGVVFDCLKLRSMRPSSAEEAGTTWSIAADHRVGPVGRFLRRTSLDELPQLWNILRGDMTMVGPRPERPHFVERFSAEFERYEHRHRMQAGLTGLAQVSGLRGDTSIADRVRYDNYYIENWSLWLDVKILLRTANEVVFARGL